MHIVGNTILILIMCLCIVGLIVLFHMPSEHEIYIANKKANEEIIESFGAEYCEVNGYKKVVNHE